MSDIRVHAKVLVDGVGSLKVKQGIFPHGHGRRSSKTDTTKGRAMKHRTYKDDRLVIGWLNVNTIYNHHNNGPTKVPSISSQSTRRVHG